MQGNVKKIKFLIISKKHIYKINKKNDLDRKESK